MRLDVNAFLGGYPFRDLPEATVSGLEGGMRRVGIDECWVSYLPAIYWRDPTAGNPPLVAALEGHAGLRPVLAVHPGLAGWEATLDEAAAIRAPAIRADAGCYGLDPTGAAMESLAAAAGERGIPVMMAVRLEDGRQRHPHDAFPSLEPSMIRRLIRADQRVRLLVTHADRDFIEQVFWGSTPEESERILWDISWLWGPPEDHLSHLIRTLGPERFCFGTGMPLRLPEASVAKLDLTQLTIAERARIEGANAAAFAGAR
jgi:Amidohydrolase